MNRNSVRNSPMPVAPTSFANAQSSGNSMFACSSIGWSSSVRVCIRARRFSFSCASSRSRLRSRYSSRTIGLGSTIRMPVSPSMITHSSCRSSRDAWPRPTTAGMSRLFARIAVCAVWLPRSVAKPAKTCFLNCSMSAGAMSCAMTTIGSKSSLPPFWPLFLRAASASAAMIDSELALPVSTFSTRSTTCSTSARRDAMYSSSISPNCSTTACSCVVSAHSAL